MSLSCWLKTPTSRPCVLLSHGLHPLNSAPLTLKKVIMSSPVDHNPSDPLVMMLTDHIEREENQFKRGEDRMERIEQDLQPIKKMYWALVGSSAVMALLLSTVLYIYSEDKSGARLMQEAIYKQGIAIEKLLQSHTELEKDYRRYQARMEREHEKIQERLLGIRK